MLLLLLFEYLSSFYLLSVAETRVYNVYDINASYSLNDDDSVHGSWIVHHGFKQL